MARGAVLLQVSLISCVLASALAAQTPDTTLVRREAVQAQGATQAAPPLPPSVVRPAPPPPSVSRPAAPPPPPSVARPTPQGRLVVHLPDARLVYVVEGGTLQITAASNVLSYGKDWESRRLKPFLFHLRERQWKGFHWQVNTSRREAWSVKGAAFGEMGGEKTTLTEVVESAGSPDRPERFTVPLPTARIVHKLGSSSLQITTGTQVLSYGTDWQIEQAKPNLVHLRQANWRDFFWEADTASGTLRRVKGGTFGQLDGERQRIDARVELQK
jgi:hypothetical protein